MDPVDGEIDRGSVGGMVSVDSPLAARILDVFYSIGYRELVLLSVIVSGVPFGLSLAVAIGAGVESAFLSTDSVYVWTGGLFGGTMTFGWWGMRYLDLLVDIRPVFAVPDDEYAATVRPHIAKMYHLGRALLWFPVPFVVGVVYDSIVDVAYLIEIPGIAPLRLGVINFAFGIVTLIGFVVGIRLVVYHLFLVNEIMKLDFRDIQTAAGQLTPLARFNIIISAGWFLSLTVGLALLNIGPLDLNEPLISISFFVVFVFGFVLSAIPQYSIHARLQSAKQSYLSRIDSEYEHLYSDVFDPDSTCDSPEMASLRLEILEARRRNTKEIQTWVYDLPGVVSLAISAVIPLIPQLV